MFTDPESDERDRHVTPQSASSWRPAPSSDSIHIVQGELKAEDIAPLVAKLSGTERARLVSMITTFGVDARLYAANPPTTDEFGAEDDPLGWDAAGWEDVG